MMMNEPAMSVEMHGHRIPLSVILCPHCDGAGCRLCEDGMLLALPHGLALARLSPAQRSALGHK